jgi:HJR/Mrr/RecB family endonuclease
MVTPIAVGGPRERKQTTFASIGLAVIRKTANNTFRRIQVQPMAPRRKQKLVQVCRRCSVTLRENLGKIKGKVEVGGGAYLTPRAERFGR